MTLFPIDELHDGRVPLRAGIMQPTDDHRSSYGHHSGSQALGEDLEPLIWQNAGVKELGNPWDDREPG